MQRKTLRSLLELILMLFLPLSFLSISQRTWITSLTTWRISPMTSSAVSSMTQYWLRRTLCWTWTWIHPLQASRQSTAIPSVETLLPRAPLCLSRLKITLTVSMTCAHCTALGTSVSSGSGWLSYNGTNWLFLGLAHG